MDNFQHNAIEFSTVEKTDWVKNSTSLDTFSSSETIANDCKSGKAKNGDILDVKEEMFSNSITKTTKLYADTKGED